MSWDALQREVLDALGHVVYRVAGSAVAPEQAANSDSIAMTPLQRAVLRASGLRGPADPAWPPLLAAVQGLRSDPAAKRALWPRLRALRGARA